MPAQSSYLDLAAKNHVMPIGTDLVLHSQSDPTAVLTDGAALGSVVINAARRWRTPLAVPLMDLRIEKESLLQSMGVPQEQIDQFHFDAPLEPSILSRAAQACGSQPTPRIRATLAALRAVAATGDLLPIGMCIGPFSLMTKLIADPITPVFLAGSGVSADEDPDVALLESVLALSERVIEGYLRMQIEAGARAVIVCEPAANLHYLSPNQLDSGSDIFDVCVMQPNRRIKKLLDEHEVDLIFHDCGELTDAMIASFGTLHPAMLSLGSSRRLWEDARLLPKQVVLYGNLPSKQFYSDQVLSSESVSDLARDLRRRMAEAGHPFILGTECDVLSVPGCEQTITRKVERMMTCHCEDQTMPAG